MYDSNMYLFSHKYQFNSDIWLLHIFLLQFEHGSKNSAQRKLKFNKIHSKIPIFYLVQSWKNCTLRNQIKYLGTTFFLESDLWRDKKGPKIGHMMLHKGEHNDMKVVELEIHDTPM